MLICVFMNFVFANTVFMHTHTLADGSRISHSHPYLPSTGGHTHSALSLDNIASFNAAAQNIEGTATFNLSEPEIDGIALPEGLEPSTIVRASQQSRWRAPPFLG